MTTKQTARRGLGVIAVALVAAIVAILLIPGLATLVGRVIANLWVTVMAAVAGILGGFMGS